MGIFSRLANLFHRDRLHDDIEEELRSHLEMSAEHAARDGWTADDARRDARRRFGNPLAMRERTADADTFVALDGIARDVRYAIAQLWRSPVFTLAAVVTLALGIGATTAVFTLVEQVMRRQLPSPVVRPSELWRVGDAVSCCYSRGYAQNDWNYFSSDAYTYFRANTPAFESLAALQVGQAELAVRRFGAAAHAEPAVGEYVSANFFDVFDVSPSRGRLFDARDDAEGAAPVAVLSFHAWTDKFASDSSVVGATYDINGHAFAIVGIAPPGFYGAKVAAGGMPDLWLPLATEPLIAGPTSRLRNPALAWLDLIARVSSGAKPQRVEAQLQGELQQWLTSHHAEMTPQELASQSRQTLHLTPGGSGVSLMRKQYERALRLLLLAALCVLLVACTNIGTLLLVRGLRDQRVTALRAALGASRGRLIREVLARSLVLSALGGVAGIAVAYVGARLILHLAFAGTDAWIPVEPTPSTSVLFFALGLSLITSVVFGAAPAVVASRVDPNDLLRGGGRSTGARHEWGQRPLITLQIAISVVLVSVAAMLGQSVRNLERQDFGFSTDGRYLVSIDSKLSNHRVEQLNPLFRDVADRLRALPGVRAASPVLYAPFSGYYWDHAIRVEGRAEPAASEDMISTWTRATPGFFETLGDKIVLGRSITDGDNAATRPVAVINQTFARKYFGSANPIGQHFGPAPRTNSSRYEVVGVAADVRFSGSHDSVLPMYFVPEAQQTTFADAELESREVWSHFLYSIVIWAPGDPPSLEANIR
ncbi:MAG TPA: ABC transporter permease, partial [Gemmatimonadaceae bacterium]